MNQTKVEFPWYEDKGFRNYAIMHYREAVQLAMAVRDAEKIPLGAAEDYNIAIFTKILDKIASPLVYLKKDYDNLSLELKEKYDPDLKGASQKAAEMFIAILSILTGIPMVLLVAGIISPVKTFGAVGWILDTVMASVFGASIGVLTAKKVIRR